MSVTCSNLLDRIENTKNPSFKINSELGFEVIDDLYKELNEQKSHFHNSNDICTPMGCVKEMVDKIPSLFWNKENIKVLDSCCGNGNFHAYIQTKTNLSNLYFNEINKERIENVRCMFGENINMTTQDFLTFDDDEKFDLVVSNPPYAKFNGDKRTSKNHNLSRDFIRKAIAITKQNGYILFIAPNNWMSYSDRNVLPNLMSKYQFLHLNIHGAKKWFPKVGSSFTWFLLQKKPNKKKFVIENHYMKKNTTTALLDNGVDFIPLYYSDEVQSIFNKTIRADIVKYKVETSSYLHRFTKKDIINDTKSTDFPYRIIHTPKQTLWSSRPHKYQNGWKVFISLTDRYSTFIDDCGMTQSIAFIRCKNKSEAEEIKAELKNLVYLFLNNLTRYGNFNNVRVLQKFPRWSEIKLTNQELLYIDKFMEKDCVK